MVGAVAVYSWVAAGLRPFTLAEEVLVAIPAILGLAVATRTPGTMRTGSADASWRGSAAIWLGLFVVRGGLGAQCLLLLTTLGPPDLERDRGRGHERASRPCSVLRALARAGLGARPRFASGAAVTSRTANFAGYAAIASLIVVWTVMTARHARWMSLPEAIDSLTRRRAVRIVVVLGWMWLGWHLSREEVAPSSRAPCSTGQRRRS